jgi:ERCC4-type nuclease
MTIYTSNLPNDQDMIKALGSLACPLPLSIGDCCFSGYDSKLIAVERKKIGDLCSCILDGRYLAQAQTSVELGADYLCLIVEGECRSNSEDGLLEVPVWGINPRTMKRCEMWVPVKPVMMYSRFDQFLTEVARDLGVIVKRSRDVQETACIIKALYINFQDPPDGHNSLHTIYKTPLRDVLLVRPGLVRRVASELPGIGWQRSKVVAERFAHIKEMCEAGVKDWSKLDGIGKKTAEKVVKALNG